MPPTPVFAMADDERTDYSIAISPEIWFMVFQQLRDPRSLANAGVVCRLFYELSGDDSLWKALSLRVYAPDARKKLRDSTHWKQFFERLSVCQIEPQWSVYTKLNSPFSFEGRSISIQFDSSPLSVSPTMRRRSRRYTSCEPLTGEGHAPFGSFDAIGCNYGSYYAVALLISEDRFTCFLNEADSNPALMSGPFHSRWSNVCGVSVWQSVSAVEPVKCPAMNAQLNERIEKLTTTGPLPFGRSLVGDFEASLAFDEVSPHTNRMRFRTHAFMRIKMGALRFSSTTRTVSEYSYWQTFASSICYVAHFSAVAGSGPVLLLFVSCP
eukprot:TRINITY_DN2380_c1_g1_i1.p1 TRINITY_DN2380_c1_g1~~TRINITY_DN2380_c1_g1_i1.p1  ORF type:complete len:324 (+),score=47.70 TRINITY_DN2380_c1_g1_i1:123-1094(+)